MRRFASDPDFRAGMLEMAPITVATAPFGFVCGVGAAAAGVSPLGAFGLSAIVFSGAAQILSVELLAAGAPLAVIVLTCFVAGLRFLIYSAAMAPYLRPLPARWQQALAFLLTDQAFATSIRRFDAGAGAHAGGMHFLGGGLALWSLWQVTNMIGYFAGNAVPSSWSLDFAVPLCFLALVAPHFRSVPMIVAALVAGTAVLALSRLPMHLNLITAGLLGIAAGTLADFARERWTRR